MKKSIQISSAICILSFFFLFTNSSFSSNWVVYTCENSGLITDLVKDIAIDSLGNKWIVNAQDIAECSDTIWVSYRHDKEKVGLSDKNCIAVDTSNNIWVGTDGWGLLKISGNTWSYNLLTIVDPDTIGVSINDVKVDRFNNLWVCTNGFGLLKFNGNTWTVYNKSNSGISSNTSRCINFDSTGNYWIGTSKGLVKYNGSSWAVFDTNNSSIQGYNVSGIAIDKFNNKWITTLEGGLVIFNDSTWTSMGLQDTLLASMTFHIAIDRNNSKWVGTYGGLIKIDSSGIITNYNPDNSPLPHYIITNILVDKNNNKWFCTYGGLAVYNENGIVPGRTFVPDNPNIGAGFPHPNPAGNITNINYTIPSNGNVKLSIYDTEGREVKVLENGFSEAGSKDVQIDTSGLTAGTYYVTMTQNGKKTVSKVIVVK